jgi:hypothetical protein
MGRGGLSLSEQRLATRRLVFGRRRSLTKGQTKRNVCLSSVYSGSIQNSISSLFLPRSIRVLAKVPKPSRQFSQINNKNAAQCHSFLLQQSTKPRFHVDSPTRLSFLRSHFHPPGALFAGLGFQSLIRVPSDSLLIG